MSYTIEAGPQTLGEQFVDLLQRTAAEHKGQLLPSMIADHAMTDIFDLEHYRPTESQGEKLRKFVLDQAANVNISVVNLPDTPPVITAHHIEVSKDRPGQWGDDEVINSPHAITGRIAPLVYIDPFNLRLSPFGWNKFNKDELGRRITYFNVEAINPDTLQPQVRIGMYQRHHSVFGKLFSNVLQIRDMPLEL